MAGGASGDPSCQVTPSFPSHLLAPRLSLQTRLGGRKGQGPLPAPLPAPHVVALSLGTRGGGEMEEEKGGEGAPLPSRSALSSSSCLWPSSPSLLFPTLSPPGSRFPPKAHIPPVLIIIVSGYKQGWPHAGVTQASVGATSDGGWRGGTSPVLRRDVLPVHPAVPSQAPVDPRPRVPLHTSHLPQMPPPEKPRRAQSMG